MNNRVDDEEPPVLIQRSPLNAECVGVSEVTQIEIGVLKPEIIGPAAIAPAVAGTDTDDYVTTAAGVVTPPVAVIRPVTVVAGVIVTAPVDTDPMPIVPDPSAFTVRFALPEA